MPSIRTTLVFLLALMASLSLAACNGKTTVPADAQDVTLRAPQNGVYALTAKELSPFGWDLAKLAAGDIRLSQGDAAIPFQLAGKGRDRQLLFYARSHPTRYDDGAVFLLQTEPQIGGAMPEREVSAPTVSPARTFTDTAHVETNDTYLAQVRQGDPWLGQRLFAPTEETIAVQTPDPAPNPARLTVTLWAATQSQEDLDHHLIFTLNDQQLGEESWDGNGPHTITLRIPAGLLTENNELVIAAPGDTGAPADLVYLDWIEVAYSRQFHAREDVLSFSSDANAFQVTDFDDGDIQVWDVTDPQRPVRLTGIQVEKAAEGYAVRFQDDAPGEKRYIAFAPRGVTPAEMTLAQAPPPLTAPENGADYIIIAPPAMLEAVEPLLAWREAQGLKTMVATTDQIYLKFSAGLQSPDAITDFLRWAVQTWPQPAPRFALLAGDASYDPLGYLSDAPNKNLIPTAFVPTVVMGETASDNAMADLDGDGLPDLAIGRFPGQTPADIAAMVDKTIAYEKERPAGDWINQLLFVADDDDSFFNTFNEEMMGLVPPGLETENLVIAPDNDIRPDLLAALNQGRGLISYMGHGAVDIWAQEEIFTTEDIAELQQEGRLPIMLVWACLNGYFQHPDRTSLGETLLLTPDKGAVAGLFPTGETFPNNQLIMARALFGESLFTSPTLGEALLGATRQLDPENAGQRDIIHTFALLGDPALRLPWQ